MPVYLSAVPLDLNFPPWWKCTISAPSNTANPCHTRLLNTWDVASTPREVNFYWVCLHLNSHTLLDNVTDEKTEASATDSRSQRLLVIDHQRLVSGSAQLPILCLFPNIGHCLSLWGACSTKKWSAKMQHWNRVWPESRGHQGQGLECFLRLRAVLTDDCRPLHRRPCSPAKYLQVMQCTLTRARGSGDTAENKPDKACAYVPHKPVREDRPQRSE